MTTLRLADHRPGWSWDCVGLCCCLDGQHRVWARNRLRVALVLMVLVSALGLFMERVLVPALEVHFSRAEASPPIIRLSKQAAWNRIHQGGSHAARTPLHPRVTPDPGGR